MNGTSKVLFPYVFVGTQMTWSTSWSQLVLDITWEQMNQKIGWVGDVIGLNFLIILFENWFWEKKSVNGSINHKWCLVQNCLWSFNVEWFLKREELAYQIIVPSIVPYWLTPGKCDRLRSSKLGYTLEKKKSGSKTGTLCLTCKCGKA